MIKYPFKILSKADPLWISPFRSKTEKDILEASTILGDAKEFNILKSVILEILGIPEKLPQSIQLAWLYKSRELSMGSDLALRFPKCPHCHRPSETVVTLENLLEKEPQEASRLKRFDPLEIDYNPRISQDWLRFESVEKPLTILEASKYSTMWEKCRPRIREVGGNCLLCQQEIRVPVNSWDFAIKSISEHSNASIYRAYNALVHHGFTQADVDQMYPFEREVQLGIIKEKTEEILGKEK